MLDISTLKSWPENSNNKKCLNENKYSQTHFNLELNLIKKQRYYGQVDYCIIQ